MLDAGARVEIAISALTDSSVTCSTGNNFHVV